MGNLRLVKCMLLFIQRGPCAGHVLRRLDPSYLKHDRPLVWGDSITC